MRKEELNGYLHVLEIHEDIKKVNIKNVNSAFRKLALKLHPDKAGDEKKAAFQRLKAAFDALKANFYNKDDKEDRKDLVPSAGEDDDDEERFFIDNFDKFIFPFENNGSFTVAIEDLLADTWQKCLSELLGEPKIIRNDKGTECDRFWKSKYMSIDITVHIWNNPKNKKGNKLMSQGSRQSIICSYVFEELPKIYKLVRLNKPEVLKIESGNTRNIPGRTIIKCDQCKYKSTLLQMKMHLKTVHGPKPQRAKRSPNFTPLTKPAKKSKSSTENMNIMINSEGIMDDSLFMIDTSFTGNHSTMSAPPLDQVQIKPLITCSKCESDFESKEDMKEHVKEIHTPFECLECSFSSSEDIILKEHTVSCKSRKFPLRIELMQVPEVNNDLVKSNPVEVEEHPAVICGECFMTFRNAQDCVQHMDTHPSK